MHQLHTEVVRHHDTLAAWLGSEAAPELLDTFHRAHHPDFVIVTVDGNRLDLPALMQGLRRTGPAGRPPPVAHRPRDGSRHIG
jgi:hypothetical protein